MKFDLALFSFHEVEKLDSLLTLFCKSDVSRSNIADDYNF